MVKKLIDIIFPVAALPRDDCVREKIISEFEKSIQLESKNVNRLLLGCILALIFFSAPITNLFSVFNTFIFICLISPTTLYLLCIILYLIFKICHVESIKLYYLIYVLCMDVLAMNGFILLIDILDPDYNYKMLFILLCVTILGYYVGYWFYWARFNTNIIKKSHIKGTEATIIILGSFIIEFLSPGLKSFLAVVCGAFIAILPAQKFVNYRQYDNIQRAKNGEPFK